MGEGVLQAQALEAVAGTRLEPFLRGFLECGFLFEVDAFLAEHAAAFAHTCPDGSHPLAWSDLHKQYVALFEVQLDIILEYNEDRSLERGEFVAYCAQLAAAAVAQRAESSSPSSSSAEASGAAGAPLPLSGGASAAQFERFLQALTASEEYERFVEVMVAAAAERGFFKPSTAPHLVTATPPLPLGCAPGHGTSSRGGGYIG